MWPRFYVDRLTENRAFADRRVFVRLAENRPLLLRAQAASRRRRRLRHTHQVDANVAFAAALLNRRQSAGDRLRAKIGDEAQKFVERARSQRPEALLTAATLFVVCNRRRQRCHAARRGTRAGRTGGRANGRAREQAGERTRERRLSRLSAPSKRRLLSRSAFVSLLSCRVSTERKNYASTVVAKTRRVVARLSAGEAATMTLIGRRQKIPPGRQRPTAAGGDVTHIRRHCAAVHATASRRGRAALVVGRSVDLIARSAKSRRSPLEEARWRASSMPRTCRRSTRQLDLRARRHRRRAPIANFARAQKSSMRVFAAATRAKKRLHARDVSIGLAERSRNHADRNRRASIGHRRRRLARSRRLASARSLAHTRASRQRP